MDNINKSPENSALRSKILTFLSEHKISVSVTAALTALCILGASATAIYAKTKPTEIPETESVISKTEEPITVSEPPAVSEISEVSSETESVTSVEPVASAPSAAVKKPIKVTPTVSTVQSGEYKYNSNSDIDDNVFLDALIYTGYNINKHRADGMMWQYVLASQKRGRGWLSNITYAGGSTGYETVGGKPDIKYFEKHGLVCASYVTYVYFNYLPNIAGIDTASLARPERSYDANCWYIAGKQWVDSGFSRYIDFTANDGGSINRDITFNSAEDIPIGSLICLQDWYNRNGHCTHICIYAGYVNGYHWVTHVGNENGPEFCAIERMNRNPHPQWPLAIITTPSNIRFSAAVEVSVKDQNGNPISGAAISIKHTSSGTVTDLGTTDSNGKVKKENLSYGEYQITQTVPNGYTCDNSTATVNFTTANNSLHSATFTNKKIEIKTQEPPATSEAATPQDEDAGSNATS